LPAAAEGILVVIARRIEHFDRSTITAGQIVLIAQHSPPVPRCVDDKTRRGSVEKRSEAN
jgi:hypothetical protein